MMKKIFFLLTAITLFFLFTGCSKNQEIPDIVKRTKGGEKWETQIDYSKKDNWLSINDTGKNVDVIYFYPTTFSKSNNDASDISDIDDLGMRKRAKIVLGRHIGVFDEECNVYVPFYRQVSGPYALTLTEDDSDDLFRYSASQDPTYALDYYFEHYNNGKPFILAGHSQGSNILIMILSDYMKEHPEYYKNMVAAYVIGYSVTKQYLEENPHLKFAEGSDDTGVIISYNTEGPGNKNLKNAVVRIGSISINPINWKRDDTYASVSKNKGSLINGKLIENLADARVDIDRGVVICKSVDSSIFAIKKPTSQFFGKESYHNYDYEFYYNNLRENVKERIKAFNNN